MPERVQKQKTAGTRENAPIEEIPKTDQKDDLKSDLDDLLDEIDGVLEENAEEFVNSYIQKGGQ